jgi:hypothetical protein
VQLDERDAFNAMFRFLESYWEQVGRPDELGNLLGSLNTELAGDGMPADRGMWEEWLEAVDAAMRDSG